MTIDGFTDRLITMGNKIEYLERSRATSFSKPEKIGGFSNDLGTLRHDVNH